MHETENETEAHVVDTCALASTAEIPEQDGDCITEVANSPRPIN